MRRRGRPPTPDILTPREWEVLDLIRAGLTNREIADRLGISLSGAKHHVSEIIGKLGVEGREEAARWEQRRRMPLLTPLAWLQKPRQRPWAGPAAVASLVCAAAILLLVLAVVGAAISPKADAVLDAEAVASSTPAPLPEPQRSTVAGYDVGYGSGGGFFDSLAGDVMRLHEQVGAGTVPYVLDWETRFLWADGERIRFDDSREGLAPGAFVSFGFDVLPAADVDAANTLASVNQIPLDYVVIGYFKYLDGTVLAIGEGVIEVQVNPQLRYVAESLFGADEGRVRVVIDPDAMITDSSSQKTGLQPGVRVGFSGLVHDGREAVTNLLTVQ